jgi:hypothetical protein
MTEEIEAAVSRAAEIADKVAPELRVAAFEKAFDALVGDPSGTGEPKPARTPKEKGIKAAKTKKPTRAGRRPSRVGGRGSLNELLEEGYFSEPRSLPDIIVYLRDSRARQFKQNDLSGSLAKMTRDGLLHRGKNSDGKYEYRAT